MTGVSDRTYGRSTKNVIYFFLFAGQKHTGALWSDRLHCMEMCDLSIMLIELPMLSQKLPV